jgi:hypothetical protein
LIQLRINIGAQTAFPPAEMNVEEPKMEPITLDRAVEEPRDILLWLALWIVAIACLLRALA